MGATHHTTTDLNNLNLYADKYDGSDQIQVDNGTDLDIQNFGTSKL